ncbi:MAG: hypothetical protein M1812_002315 [Candelaria pacifica]|nr:MAG: hypothetical protein M1812_002315 [Candelaria pacifica]
MASLRHTSARLRPLARFSTSCLRAPATISTTRRPLATAATASAMPQSSAEHPFFPDEPLGPQLRTAIPGPESKKAIQHLDRVFDTRSLNMMADYRNSYLN